MADIRFLSVDDVLQIQHDTLAVEGGLAGLRDVGLLASAVMMPQQQFDGAYLHDGLAAMAAAYLYHLSQNHAFIDGKKRVAVMSALIFLDVNGVETLPDPKELERIALAVAAGQIQKQTLTEWMRQQTGDPRST